MTDAELLDKLAEKLHNYKWEDVLPEFRPFCIESGYRVYIERYINRDTFKEQLKRYFEYYT
jgi:hypothetical protein